MGYNSSSRITLMTVMVVVLELIIAVSSAPRFRDHPSNLELLDKLLTHSASIYGNGKHWVLVGSQGIHGRVGLGLFGIDNLDFAATALHEHQIHQQELRELYERLHQLFDEQTVNYITQHVPDHVLLQVPEDQLPKLPELVDMILAG